MPNSGQWWRDAVFYEIYVRSFQDSDGDGVGDLPGIRRRLPYLKELGVDGLWLTPFYPSPGVDNGYDVADYIDVDPRFGSLDDFDALLTDAHELGLRVTIDLVPNHTSNRHRWFTEHPDYYVWGEPNNWPSWFGGSAWTFDERRGSHYLHLFAREQPDLDWHNPDVKDEFDRILRFWLDRGVDGFRIDVAHALYKDAELRDETEPFPMTTPFSSDWRRAVDQPEVHPLYREWRALADSYEHEPVLVGEVVFSDPERIAQYVRRDELHLAFNFPLLFEEWDAQRLRATIDRTLAAHDAVGATPSWVLENHDVMRVPMRYGSVRAARAGALLLLALPGTAFIHQGQELGLEEVDLPDAARQDPIFHRTNGARTGRDGCRVPIPWTPEPPGHGFTEGPPWLPPPPGWGEVSVAAQQDDPGSTLALFRAALALRPRGEAFAWLDSPSGSLAFERGGLACLVNVDAPAVELPPGELLLASTAGVATSLPPNTAAWVRRET